jgi:uncharacterized protein (DUF2225 family)
MELDDKDERKRMRNMMDLIQEEEMKLMALGMRERAKDNWAWARVRDLMVRLGVQAPKKEKK